jgi:hypothetical protein
MREVLKAHRAAYDALVARQEEESQKQTMI